MKIYVRVWAQETNVPLGWLTTGEWPTASPDVERPAPRARKTPAKRTGRVRAPRRGAAS